MPAEPTCAAVITGSVTREDAFWRHHISERSHRFRARLARELLEFRRLLRVPPAAANDDAFGSDLAVTDQVLTDDVDIVELALLDRNQGGVADAPRLEAAEFGTLHRHRRINRRRRDHVRQRHPHAQEL